MLTKRANHGLPASDALPLFHVQCITDRLGDFELVIRIDNQRVRKLLGGPGEF